MTAEELLACPFCGGRDVCRACHDTFYATEPETGAQP